MKTNKIMVTSFVTVLVLLGFVNGVSAMGEHGKGSGQGFGKNLTSEQRAELQSMSESERQAYMENMKAEQGINSTEQGKGKRGGKEDHNPADMITNIPMQDLSSTEIDLLEKQYEEEIMANELYTSFYEMYGLDTFNNIAQSEAKHMEAVKALFDRYSIDIPTNYDHIQDLYDSLKEKGALSLQDALEVGVSIEIVDIDDIYTAILASDNDDIRTVLVNIGGASYNHMRGFVKALTNNGFTTDIDYSDYLSSEDINIQGPIKVKLAEKLEANGVILPEGATVAALNEKCKNKKGGNDQDKREQGRGNDSQENHRKNDHAQKSYDNTNYNKYTSNSELRGEYKKTYEIKYGKIISKMDDSALNILIEKIDEVIEKINNKDYSNTVKEKYNAMLYALKDIAIDNLDMEENIFDGLF